MYGNRLVWKIGFIIGIICHLQYKRRRNLPLLVVSGENEDVTVGLLSSMMYANANKGIEQRSIFTLSL